MSSAKKLAELIAAKAKPKSQGDSGEEVFGQMADEVLAAVGKKDRSALGKALKNIISAAGSRREGA